MTDDLAVLVKSLLDAQEEKRLLTERIEDLMTVIGDQMQTYQVTVDGVGTIKRHGKKNRLAWQKDDLLRAVLDTRIIDPDTGEIASEKQKILKIWNLGAPRTTALREIGLDADEFCTTETRPGWTLEIIK